MIDGQTNTASVAQYASQCNKLFYNRNCGKMACLCTNRYFHSSLTFEGMSKSVQGSQTSKDYRLLNGACFLHQYCKRPQQKEEEKKPILRCASSGHNKQT